MISSKDRPNASSAPAARALVADGAFAGVVGADVVVRAVEVRTVAESDGTTLYRCGDLPLGLLVS